MRFAFVIGLYPYQIGGAEMQSLEIAHALKGMGHEVAYVCFSSKKYESEEYEVHFITRRFGFDVFYWETRNQIYSVLKNIKPDIVYHRAFVPYSCYVASWCKSTNTPFYFHSADIYTLIRRNDSLQNILLNKMLAYTLKNATGVICQNSEQEEALKMFDISRVRKIYNIQRTNDESLLRDKQPNIVWIAKLEDSKQPEVFVDFIERYTRKDVRFSMFISRIDDNDKNRRLISRLNLNAAVTLYKGKDNTFINKFLIEKATVLVNTSVSEGISNTFIQAWMRGVPVISLNSNPDGWFDQYELGGCCKGNPLKIETLVDYIHDKSNYSRLSNSVVEFSEGMFSPAVVMPQILDFMGINRQN